MPVIVKKLCPVGNPVVASYIQDKYDRGKYNAHYTFGKSHMDKKVQLWGQEWTENNAAVEKQPK